MIEKVSVLGNLTLDFFVGPLDFPISFQEFFPVSHITMKPGGGARNLAMALSRMGIEVELLSLSNAEDPLFTLLLEDLKSGRVGVRGIFSGLTQVGKTVIFLDSKGRRSICAAGPFFGIKSEVQKAIEDLNFPIWDEKIMESDWLVGKAFPILIPWFQKAYNLGKKIFCDFSTMEVNSPMKGLLERCQFAQLSRPERTLDQLKKEFLPVKFQKLIITQGGEGLWYWDKEKGGPVHYPIPEKIETEKIIDTTGAGDSFLGCFLGSTLLNWGLTEAITQGQRGAGRRIQEIGG